MLASALHQWGTFGSCLLALTDLQHEGALHNSTLQDPRTLPSPSRLYSVTATAQEFLTGGVCKQNHPALAS